MHQHHKLQYVEKYVEYAASADTTLLDLHTSYDTQPHSLTV